MQIRLDAMRICKVPIKMLLNWEIDFFQKKCNFVLPRIQENYPGPLVACRVDVYNYLYTSVFFRPASVT
jgi:hypothetical protein